MDNLVPQTPPNGLLPWLTAKKSITKMAEMRCQTVNVSLLESKWIKGKMDQTDVYSREILMYCDNQPWWYARTLIPYATFLKRAHTFETLGEASLGCVLFSDKHIMRTALDYFSMGEDDEMYQVVQPHSHEPHQPLWARQSTFGIEKSPLYLLEVFLPPMLRAIA